MRYYAPYIAAFFVIIFMGSALFHHGSRFRGRVVKYGNPAKEKLIQEAAHINKDGVTLKFRLYMGSDGSGGACWYSVTYENDGRERQVFASFDNPVVNKINACDRCLSVICGKNKIKIPVEELEQRVMVPLVYYQGEELKDKSALSDEI
jgi:hypothetical protein